MHRGQQINYISRYLGQTLSEDILSLVDMVIDYLWHQLIFDEIYQHHLAQLHLSASHRIVSYRINTFLFLCLLRQDKISLPTTTNKSLLYTREREKERERKRDSLILISFIFS